MATQAVMLDRYDPPSVPVPGANVPVRRIDSQGLKGLATKLIPLFDQYRADRWIQEQRWLRNLRQYLGYYDTEVEKALAPERSRAYPKMTRVKCIAMLARIMDLMFPSDDENWTLKARPSADMNIKDVKEAITEMVALDTAANGSAPTVDEPYVMKAVTALACKRADALKLEIQDQLQELGGDQSYDYVRLNKQVVASGILYGLGLLHGPLAREVKTSSWSWDAKKQQPVAKTMKTYMPMFEFVRVWDCYPDLAAKRLEDGDGYFMRRVMSRQQVRDLADRDDFFEGIILQYLSTHTIGNYRPQTFETELRSMGIKANVNEQKTETTKYEIIIWHGKIDGTYLQMAGVQVDQDKLADQIDAEVWMLDGFVIKAVMNPWATLDMQVRTLHHFVYDFDDTAPVGFGLPNVLRDTQMSICAATRMMLDNASVVCGPILEMNTQLLVEGQDLTSLHAWKTFYRDDTGPTAQWPAVRPIEIPANIPELKQIIDLFMSFADIESFVNPANGGDMDKMPSEPMRSAAGASMLMGNAALPFKDTIRNFDSFTQSVILSLVQFNRLLNPAKAPTAEYDVIARGATSLIAKEIRGMQIDQLATTLTDDEKLHVNDRKMAEARFRVRDLTDMLVSQEEAARRKAQRDQMQADQQQKQDAQVEAITRNYLAQAFKNLAQGQKNQVTASAETANTALDILEADAEGHKKAAETLSLHASALRSMQQGAGGMNAGGSANEPGSASGGSGVDGSVSGGGGGGGTDSQSGAAPSGPLPPVGGSGVGGMPLGPTPGAPSQGQGLF